MPARNTGIVRLKVLIQTDGESHFGFHAAFLAQPNVPAVIQKNRPGDFRRVEGRKVFDLLEHLAQRRIRRLVFAGFSNHFRRDGLNIMNHFSQHPRLEGGSTTRTSDGS